MLSDRSRKESRKGFFVTDKKIKSINDYSVPKAAFYVISHPRLFLDMISFIVVVLRDFFLIQFLRKFGLSKTPVAKVDNELDDKIPFTPSKIGTYLDFTAFWIRPMAMMIEKLDHKKANFYISDYLKKITLAYHSASRVYRMCMSTTARPKYYKMFYFRVIHFFDPHYLCVPSLHISVVSLVWSFYRNAFKEMPELTQEEKDLYLSELYDGAIKIAETVLYIKQHSVNCIPAALYMMTFLMRPAFTAEDGIQFLRDMFVKTNIPVETQKELKDYMYFIYERFLLVGITDDNWISPIRNWLKEYCINSNQEHIARKIK